ncbi:MAG: hypothetical protein ACO36E_12410 [Synechocystis sp.]
MKTAITITEDYDITMIQAYVTAAARLITAFLLTLGPGMFPAVPLAKSQAAPITVKTPVSLRGINGISIGMTRQEAQAVSGQPLVGDGNSACAYYTIPTVPGLAFMVTQGRIARIDILDNSPITTLSGAKIGDTESRIKALYPGKIQVEPHKYDRQGHYLVFVPQDAVDKNYRLIFETNGNVVTRWRVGKLPEVAWVEGCS